ncbi:MAG TPA: hypothetical protein VM370_12110 [Candidatus Thermoplasmatota archaeon]|nr:hypothetical protein [Candidatus Thermoplasmatota archaeon]
MHARYVRVWFVGGLAALILSIPMMLAREGAHAALAVVGVGWLALALALGLLPAFARRDWPSPLYAMPALLLGALALPLLRNERAFDALLGASLVVGALQPLALLASPRWAAPQEADEHRATDRVALAALATSLGATLAGGILLVALPRGLPSAAFVALLVVAIPLAALAALLFTLPRQARAPLKAATLAWASGAFLVLAGAALAGGLVFPLASDLRGPVAGVALAFALAIVALLRAPRRPPLAAAALALEVLSALALLLATLYGAPNALLPVALYAFLALAIVLVAGALLAAAPILLPGTARGVRWQRWAPALLIAALFLYTPALQLGRSPVPAAIVGAAGVVLVVFGLGPLARSSTR